MSASTTTVYEVEGMTCGHCVSSVDTEVRGISSVTDVDVDLPTGRLTVTSNGPVDDARVRAAVEEAGYAVKVG
ncbi:copper chaperone [Nocardiopsis gilva YIM 90087]|uniref:Copper chaperone n=1 Tax=Nocardiopsis gilva YIM 90087 TaxID=1235441 RepID=A0A223SCU4_9ACTN|nr:heavy-metal-associated domain-containing protein [Nocardiopsis gilva]ASU85906.1 copper chaperone [Nocardiopsis gilva YIM 90087]